MTEHNYLIYPNEAGKLKFLCKNKRMYDFIEFIKTYNEDTLIHVWVSEVDDMFLFNSVKTYLITRNSLSEVDHLDRARSFDGLTMYDLIPEELI